uniref:Capsid protein n=1 Tax=Citrus chlorotic dwarf associated virus TaxID=1202142 RepID=A0A2U9PEL9_9GEMI|nr:coat protein [Citrus chlorotic dwarf associated virus]
MVSTRSGGQYGTSRVTTVETLPMWATKRRRRPRWPRKEKKPKIAGAVFVKARPRRKSSKGVPPGCKGPCKTHTVDVIKTIYHDGRGSGMISNIDRGDELGQREGRKIRVSRMIMRGKIWLDVNNASVPGSNLAKIWIFKDRRPGTEPVAFNALMDMSDSEPLSAFVKVDYRDRFIALHTMTVDLHGGKDFRVDELDLDELVEINSDVLFSHEDDGSVAHTIQNGIFIYYACSDPRQTVQITAQARLYFYDSTSN